MPSLASHWALHVKWFYFFKILSYCIKIENITYNFTPHLSQTFKFICIHFPSTSFYVRRLTVPPPYLSQFSPHVYCRFHLSTSFIKTFYFVLEYSQSILKEINPEYSLGGLMFQYLATWLEELTHWERPWCWENWGPGGEEGDRGWDGWMASLAQWTWIWANSERWWRTGSLVCCSLWGQKELDTTEQLNNIIAN